MKRKLSACILALFLLTLLPLPAAAETDDAQMRVVSISSAEDLLEFAENCALDTWSRDVQVNLLADISLKGTDFEPISTFGGSFDGGGHTIRDLNVTQSVAPAGLFGVLQSTAVVKDLNVQGTVAPEGDGKSAGGIVGENYGTLENCTFTGTVEGKTNIGGVAGSSEGTLTNCTAQGSVTGENHTGGIVGYNDGAVLSCSSGMSVNTQSVDPAVNVQDIDLNFNLDFSQASDVSITDASEDTGGIAGYSGGSLVNCVNTGQVGYPHIGYNLGGIVGRTGGLVENCRNEGHITGRKDVGGIVGQIEPHVQTLLSPDYMSTLSDQFENLGSLVGVAGSNGAASGGNIQNCVQTISAYQASARAALQTLMDSVGDWDQSKAALADLENAVHGMVSTSGNLKNIIAQGVDTLTGDINAITGQIDGIANTFALATEDAKQDTVVDISDAALDEISDGKVLGCRNEAAVEGDLNVGGIAGTMGLESRTDPEDDTLGGSLTRRRRYTLKAVVQDCENLGTITGKRSYVGCICGRMELGLISQCRGYGTASSENGDYVGGIAGLTGGIIRDSYAKCTLSGNSYIGGIVGSGIGEDYSGDSSTVTGCHSMVEISGAEQYVGAISGVNIGVFAQNYFVSDTLEGINRISYQAVAEPLAYDALRGVESLPKALREFTLSFVADGEVIKTRTFRYGDSFDDSVFPEIPQKEGCYARWSIRELKDLRFDTVVEAAYYPYITALPSTQLRTQDKPVLFVQGQFQQEDVLRLEPGTTDFFAGKPLEQWQVTIPADGLETHRIRYLPEQENCAVYLLKNGIWTRTETQDMGSYLSFEASGAQVEFAVVEEQAESTPWWLLIAAAAAIVLLVLLLILRKKGKGKWKRLTAAALVLVLLGTAAGALYSFPRSQAGQELQIYDLLKATLEQPELSMDLTVEGKVETQDAGFTAHLDRTRIGEKPLTVISQDDRKLYYADGVVLLENGAAYRLNTAAPDYSTVLETVLEACSQTQIYSDGDVYTVTAEKKQATQILKLLLPSVSSMLPETGSLTVDFVTADGNLTELHFTGAGNLTDSVKTPFSVSAELKLVEVTEPVAIPAAVAKAVTSGNYQAQEMYSDDLVALAEAWVQLCSYNPVSASVALEAGCGELTLSDAFDLHQWKTSGTTIRAMEKDGKISYFTENAICDETGRKLPVSAREPVDAAKLIDIALEGLEHTRFSCEKEGQLRTYTFTMGQSGMESVFRTAFPKAENMEAIFEKGRVQLTVENGNVQNLTVTLEGTGKLAAASAQIRLKLDAHLLSDSPGPALPDAVREALEG